MPMRSRARALSLWIVAGLLFGCSGGGGCGGCDGMEPIPGGFPLDRRVENAVQMRMTPDGVTFLEDNVDQIVASAMGGTLLFEVPPTTQNM